MATVLLVDDDIYVCAVLKAVLQSDGHNVVCATNAASALNVLDTDRTFGLVVTDLNLPGGEDAAIGLALAARMRRPQLQVLYISAMGLRDAVAAQLVPGSAYLPKPFGPEQLLDTVRRLLGATGDGGIPPVDVTPLVGPQPYRSR